MEAGRLIGYYSPSANTTRVDVALPDITALQIEFDQAGVTVTFNGDVMESSSAFSGEGNHTYTSSTENFSKLPHNLVCEVLGITESDVPLTTIERQNNLSDTLTPDSVIIKEDGSVEVIEVKTCAHPEHMMTSFLNAQHKYADALMSRSLVRRIDFYVVVVGRFQITTNMRLSRRQHASCVTNYLLGQHLQIEATYLGWVNPKATDDQIQLEKDLYLSSSSVNLPRNETDVRGNHDPLIITQKDVEKWRALGIGNMRGFMHANIKAAVKHVTDNTSTPSDFEITLKGFDDFGKKIDSVGTHMSHGTIVHLPIALVKPVVYNEHWHQEMFAATIRYRDSSEPLFQVWQQAFTQAGMQHQNFTSLSVKEMEILAHKENGWELIKGKMTEKTRHFTVDIALTKPQRLTLALRGVQAKEFKTDDLVKQKQKRSREPLKFETDTSDIDSSFNKLPDLLSKWELDEPPVELKLQTLLTNAMFLSGQSHRESEVILKRMSRMKIFHMLTFLSQVVEEVNISRLKHLKKDRFILKRLPDYNAYVLLKTTSTDKMISFSLAVKKEDFHGSLPLSEDWQIMGKLMVTNFVSLDRHKISHLLYSQYKLASLLLFWYHQFEIPFGQMHPDVDVIRSINNHWWATVLVFLEDKDATSRNLQLIRYAYMEMIKGGLLRAMPEKICKKMDHVIRSRLHLWIVKRVGNRFCDMVLNRVRMTLPEGDEIDKESSLDKAEGLLSWVDGTELKRFSVALNLSYLGVLHNKEETNLTQGYLKIFNKVIEQELLLENTRVETVKHRLESDGSKLLDHEFSAAAVKSFAHGLKRSIARRVGDYDHWIMHVLTPALARVRLEDFATTKASGTNDAGEFFQEGDGRKSAPRRKCLENVISYSDDKGLEYSHIFTKISQLIEDVEQSGGVKVSLFKKQQIGGTREIFILDIKTRMLINYLETISRTICEEVECEMLTKGDQKLVRSDLHFQRRARLNTKAHTMTFISSDDAATWAQRFIMPVFGVMLTELVPDPYLNPCLRILNLVTSKKLILPDELLSLFYKHKDVLSTSDSLCRLKEEFLHEDVAERRLVNQAGRLMTNRSNMMQGILHYTSSLLHACYLTTLTDTLPGLLKMSEGIGAAIVTSKVSSDDSSMMVTIGFDDPDKKNKVMKLGSLMCALKREMYPLICAKQSDEKSTMASTTLIEEFNSLWFIRNTLEVPSIKYIAQACRTHVTDKFVERQQTMSNLIKQVYENTGSTLLAAFCQSCQLRCHYLSLGASSHSLFPALRELLMKYPHPCLGYFVLEPELLTGMFGYPMALYTACKRSIKMSEISSLVETSTELEARNTDYSCTKISVTQGSTTRYKAMLNRLHVKFEDLLVWFDENPSVLCRPAMTKEELSNQLRLKASTPSIARSFEFMTDSKLHAASSYMLHTDCVQTTERRLPSLADRELGEKAIMTSVRRSLLNTIKVIGESATTELTKTDISWIFPMNKIYDQAYDMAQDIYVSHRLGMDKRRRRTYVIHNMPKYDVDFHASPLEVVKHIWFGFKPKHTRYQTEQTWATMISRFPWITERVQETLDASPFNSMVGLMSFIRSLGNPYSSVRVIGPGRAMPGTIPTLHQLACHTYWPLSQWYEKPVAAPPGHPVTTEHLDPVSKESSRIQAQNIITQLWLLKESWEGLNLDDVQAIFRNCPDIVSKEDSLKTSSFHKLGPLESKMALFQLAIKHKVTDMGAVLSAAKKGVRGSFIRRAKYCAKSRDYVGDAVFRGFFNKIAFDAHIQGSTLTKLVLKSRGELKIFLVGLKEALSYIGVRDMGHVRERGVYFFDYTCNIMTQKNGPGPTHLPVSFDRALKVNEVHHNVRFSLRDDDTLRLLAGNQLDYTCVLSHRVAAPRDLISLPISFPRRSEMSSWITAVPLPSSSAKEIIERLSDHTMAKSLWDKTKSDWVRKTLRERLIMMGSVRRELPDMDSICSSVDKSEFGVKLAHITTSVGAMLEGDFDFDEWEGDYEDDVVTPEVSDTEEDTLAVIDTGVSGDNVVVDVFDTFATYTDAILDDADPVAPLITQAKLGSLAYWDNFIAMWKSHSTFSQRSSAMRGAYRVSDDVYTKMVAKLYGAKKPLPDVLEEEPEPFVFDEPSSRRRRTSGGSPSRFGSGGLSWADRVEYGEPSSPTAEELAHEPLPIAGVSGITLGVKRKSPSRSLHHDSIPESPLSPVGQDNSRESLFGPHDGSSSDSDLDLL